MRKPLNLFLAAAMALTLSAGASFADNPSSMVTIGEDALEDETEVELKIGDKAPEFSLPNLSTDKMESLKDFLGKPTILFFIQSACYSCLQEAKAFQEMKDRYKDQINVIAVGVDLLGKPMLVTWASHNNITYPVLLDPIFSVPEKYGFSYTPSSVVIDCKSCERKNKHPKYFFNKPHDKFPSLIDFCFYYIKVFISCK